MAISQTGLINVVLVVPAPTSAGPTAPTATSPTNQSAAWDCASAGNQNGVTTVWYGINKPACVNLGIGSFTLSVTNAKILKATLTHNYLNGTLKVELLPGQNGCLYSPNGCKYKISLPEDGSLGQTFGQALNDLGMNAYPESAEEGQQGAVVRLQIASDPLGSKVHEISVVP